MVSCVKHSSIVVKKLEEGFYRWGYFVTHRPWIVIIASLLVTLLCSIGFINLTFETDANKIWAPDGSLYVKNNQWLSDNFPQDKRVQTIIFQSQNNDNILSPESVKSMLRLHKEIAEVRPHNISFPDICHRVPISEFLGKKNCGRERSTAYSRRKRDALKPLSRLVPHQKDNILGKLSENDISHDQLFNTIHGGGNSQQDGGPSNKTISIERAEQLSNTTSTPIPKLEYEYDYDSEYDYNYEYNQDEEDHVIDDCNDFTHLLGNQSHHINSENHILDSLPPNVYCELVNTLETKCLEQSILEIWMYHEETINRLTQEDILFAINKLERSPYFGFTYHYADLLGSIKRNETGHIVAAKSAMHHFITVVDLNNLSSLGLADAGTEPAERLDEANYQWQWEAIQTISNYNTEHEDESINIRVRMTRSFTDVSSSAVFFDMKRVVFCVIIMFVYTSLMLGKMDFVEQRIYLTIAGMVSVLMGIVISVGVTSALGFPYMPHYAILPFIMIGLGIDDMFVIVESWYNLAEASKKMNSLEENVALTLKDAGVAITVTSLTDICAFLIGCITLLPGLKAFCLTCAIGIAAVYLLQVSWFVAWMYIDQRRIENGRNGIFPCVVHKTKLKPDQPPGKNLGKVIFKWYSSLLEYNLYRFFVIIITLGFLSSGLYGTINIKQEYDEIRMLPPDTYLRDWFGIVKEDFPDLGQNVKLFTGALNSPQELLKLDSLLNKFDDMMQRNFIVTDIDSWWTNFKKYMVNKGSDEYLKENINADKLRLNLSNFSYHLSDFLHDSEGAKYKSNIIFNDTLICNKPVPAITASSSDITYKKFEGPKEHIPSVNFVENLIQSYNFSSSAFTNGRIYGIWEIDKVIVLELWRNLACAIACVLVITFVLLSDICASIQVLVCVVLTLLDVVGILYFWDITIDVISCCCIIVTVGLCIDYSAHIARAFLVSTGSRLERAQKALHIIGPAVMNGGTTTFLAVILLCDSKSHAFITFFKVFLLSVIFGLFHALVFFPVILSFENPFTTIKDKSSRKDRQEVKSSDNHTCNGTKTG